MKSKLIFTLVLSVLLCSCASDRARLHTAELKFNHQDYNQSLKYLEAPARHGDPQAQYALGYLYYYGLGVVEDRNVALYWFSLSAAQGNLEARHALEELNAKEHADHAYHIDPPRP